MRVDVCNGSACALNREDHILHEMDKPQSLVIEAVSQGWPKILSNMKSLLETGEVALTSHS